MFHVNALKYLNLNNRSEITRFEECIIQSCKNISVYIGLFRTHLARSLTSK